MFWPGTPKQLRQNPHFRRRLKIIDQVSLRTGMTVGASSVLLSAYLGDNAGDVILYAIAPFLAIVLIGLTAWILRLRVIGFMPTDLTGLLPIRAQHWARTWWMMRIGLIGASTTILIAAAVATFADWHGLMLFWAAVYVMVLSMLGSGTLSVALNLAMIGHRNRRRQTDHA